MQDCISSMLLIRFMKKNVLRLFLLLQKFTAGNLNIILATYNWHLHQNPNHIKVSCISSFMRICHKQKNPTLKSKISFSLSNRLSIPLSVLIIGWWSSNTGSQARGELWFVPKVICDKLSSHRLNPYLSPSRLSPPPPLCPFRLPIHHMHPLQIQSVLIPPPLGHPWPQSLICHQTQVHNWPGCKKIKNSIKSWKYSWNYYQGMNFYTTKGSF